MTYVKNGTESAFPIEGAEQIMADLECTQIKAPSADKTDITMEIYDRVTGYNTIVGYSIKSELGHPPTLLNASKATNCCFLVSGVDDETADGIFTLIIRI